MAPSNSNAGIGGNAVSGTEIIIEAVPGKTIKLPFASLEGITFTQNAGNLIIAPADGGEPVLLQDFLSFGVTENPPKIEFVNGEVMEISQITPLVQGYSVADINPQAGEDYSAGGGASFQPFHDGSIGDPLGIADLLPPTELSFSRDEIDEIIGKNQDVNPFSTPNPDDPFGRVTLTFETPRGQGGSDSGGYEDWQPNQNVGDTTEYPMQMVVNFTPDTDEELTSVDISGFPAGSKFFVGGTGPGNEVDVTSGSVSVAAVGGVLPVMYLLPPANSDADIPMDVTANFVDGGGLTGTADVSSIAVIDAVADAPALSGGDASGGEDTAISIPEVSAALQDTDGSESLNVSIGGVPVGATLSDGTHNFVGDGSDVDVTGWDLANLTITPVADDDTDFSLTVTATATEAATVAGGGELTDANNTATTSFTVNVTVDPVSDTPSVVVEDAAGKEDLGTAADQIASIPAPADGNIPLSITLTTGEGGTENGWVILSGYPAGVAFSVGAADVGGWRVDLADLGTLAITGLPADSDGDFSITVTPWSQDGAATPVAGADGTIDVLIDAVADIPTLTLDGGAANSSASGDENTAIALPDIAAGLQDVDGSETLSISIGGVPTGATLSDGVNNFVGDGSADANVTGWDLANLAITSATDDSSDFTLTVTATATEGAMEASGVELQDDDNSASTSFTIDVTVNDGPTAVADGPDYITEPLDTHAVFVIDTSASLSQSDLAVMEEALKNLATTLFAQNPEGTKITLIDFDTHASFIGGGNGTFTTLASVLTALDNLDSSSGGATNYYDALTLTQTVDFEPGYEKAIYFISDGQPTQGNTQGGINDFNSWVTNDLGGADVYAVGVGSDAQNSIYLGQIDNTPIDNNNDPNPGDPYLYVATPGDLDASLVTSNVHLEGNVLDNDVPGTDPLAAVPIVSIAYKGETYDLGDGADPNVTVDGNALTLDSDFGVLTLNFETGEYSYIANTDISNFENELFSYTIADTGGSTSTAILTIQITPDSSYTGTPGADDIIGGTGNDYIAGQAGDDSLFGGNGDDRFVFQNASTDGHDVIHDFGANGDSDVIDLSALFDVLGIAPVDRADHVVLNQAGSDTTITVIDGSNAAITDFSIVVENASLDATDITNHKIVVDES